MKLRLVDVNLAMVEAWMRAFSPHQEVEIHHGSIVEIARDCVVSPANSYGFMDGGVDLVYLRHFGHHLQDRVRAVVYRRREEMIPVGAAELVYTDHGVIPHLIVAPTMEMPEPVPRENARRAFAAVLRLWDQHVEIEEIYCPGLCTGIGKVSPPDAASEMASAYADWKIHKQSALQNPQGSSRGAGSYPLLDEPVE